MKKNYTTPEVEVLEIQTVAPFAGSLNYDDKPADPSKPSLSSEKRSSIWNWMED